MIKALAALLLGGLTLAACQPRGTANSGPDIIIASDLPLSALPAAQASDQAIAFAIRQQPAVDGLKLAYWGLDDSLGADFNQVRGRENVRRMIADRRVLAVVGPFSSPLANVELPEANNAGLAMLSPWTTNFCLTSDDPICGQGHLAMLRPTGGVNYFRIAPPDPVAGKYMARYAATRLNVRRVAVLNEFDKGSLYISELSNELANYGGQVVLQQNVDAGTKDFSGFLEEARARHADAVAAIASGDDNVCLMAPQMRNLVPGAVLLGIDGTALNDSCVSDAGPTPPTFYATYPNVDARNSADPQVKQRVAAYLAAYPKPSDVNVDTFAAYDCARILIDAIDRAIRSNAGQVPSRPQVVTALAATNNFVGVTGTFSFDKNGDAISPMMSMYRLDSGRWVNVPL